MENRFPGIFLLFAVFVIAVCGLIYELIAAALSSYLIGGSVTNFSIVIGVFLTAMGIGSYLTRYINHKLIDFFVGLQLAIGLIGGVSGAVLFLSFAVLPVYLPVLISVLTIIGTLVGMEIPILIRILKDQGTLRITVSNVLALDYLGALIASLSFPLFLLPNFGILRTSFVCGLINVGVSATALRVLKNHLIHRNLLAVGAGLSAVILVVGFLGSGAFTSFTELLLYQDNIIFSKQTPYQKIVVTRWHNDIRLYIDGHLQFSSVDEHRYHEGLVHPAMAAMPGARRVLIIGGGDGMTARELLKYPGIDRIDLVDLDAEMVRIFSERPVFAQLAGNSFSDKRVTVHVQDAGKFLEQSGEMWDLIISDLPDPGNVSLARLYTKSFYKLISQHLNTNGIVVTQATSPFYAREAFWCIVQTWKEASSGPDGEGRFHVHPYHVYVPSFGDWGFVMASRRSFDPLKLVVPEKLDLKFLTSEIIPTLFSFPKDLLPTSRIQSNRLDNQVLVKYYRNAWKRFGL